MLSITELSLALAVVLVIYALINRRKKPPGPWNIPFYSGVFAIEPAAHITFQKWAKKYGPLVSVKMGFKNALIIDDAKLMREAFNDPAFSGRPESKITDLISGGKHGINFADGEEWAEQRRFVVRTLRDFGFGKHTMEGFIMREVSDFLKWMKENEGAPIRMDRRFVFATVSSLWTLMTGERQNQDNKILEDIIENGTGLFNDLASVNGVVSLFPQLVDILPKAFFRKWHNLVALAPSLLNTFSDAVDDHIKNPVDENSPRDLIDVYLNEVKKTKDPNSSFYQERGRQTLKAVVGNLYIAGQGTTSSTLTWTVLYLIRNPEVQAKLQRELDTFIGRSRPPCLADRLNVPYTEALTREVFRCGSIVPLALVHETMEDTKLAGYEIKKGTLVFPNLYSMHYSEAAWGDPQNFRPERFLSADEKALLKNKEFMPFGTGKRVCAGEAFARDNYFLFLTSIFQRFQILPDPEDPTPTLEAVPGFLRDAKPFKVVIKEREQ